MNNHTTSKEEVKSNAAASVPVVFNFHSHTVRTVIRNGEAWFVASDVCKALGYQNTSKAVGDHLDDDERSYERLGRTPNDSLGVSDKHNESLDLAGRPSLIINESGLYALVLRSRKPEARKFAKWVTSEVLPSIRKNGSYIQDDAGNIDYAANFLGLLSSGRWLLTFGERGFQMRQIEAEAGIFKMADVPKVIQESVFINDNILSEIAATCLDRLSKSCTYYKGKYSELRTSQTA